MKLPTTPLPSKLKLLPLKTSGDPAGVVAMSGVPALVLLTGALKVVVVITGPPLLLHPLRMPKSLLSGPTAVPRIAKRRSKTIR